MATLRDDKVIFTLVTKLDEKSKGSVDKLKKKTVGLETGFKKAGSAFSKIIPLVTVGASILAIGAITNKAIKLASTFEQTTVSFKTLTGSITKAKGLVDQLESFSVITPFTPDEILKAGKTLLAFGLEADRIGDVINNLGEAAAATGADMNNLAFIFGQARATGVLFTQDLNQLANAGLPILKLLADEMGEAEGNIRKLASEGKITFDVLDGAFRRAAQEGGKFNGALKAQSETLAGLQSTAVGVRDAFLRAFGGRLLGAAKAFQRTLIGIWNAALDFVKVDLATELGREKDALNLLVDKIDDATLSQEQRNELIFELNDKYPDFLANMDAEKVTLEEIRDRLREVNTEYENRIALAIVEKEFNDQLKEVEEAAEERGETINNASKLRAEALKDRNLALTESERAEIAGIDSVVGRNLKLLEVLRRIEKEETGQRSRRAASFRRRSKNFEAILIEAQKDLDIERELLAAIKARLDEQRKLLGAPTIVEEDVTVTPGGKDGPKIKIPEGGFRIPEETGFNLFTSNLFSVPEDAPRQARNFWVELFKLAKEEAERLNAEIDLELSLGVFKDIGVGAGDDPLKTLAEQYQELGDAALFASDVAQQAIDAQIDKINELIDVQERRVDKAKDAAERGNAEQLQLEEERLNKLLEKRAAAARRQREIDALQIVSAQAVAAAESIKAIAAGFAGPGGLVTGIATVVALAASIGAIVLTVSNAFSDLPSFDVGIDSLPGDTLANVHKNERILTADQNAAIGSIPNAEIPGLVNAGLAARMDTSYLYDHSGEMVELLKESNHKMDDLIFTALGDGARLSQYLPTNRGSNMSRTRAQLLR